MLHEKGYWEKGPWPDLLILASSSRRRPGPHSECRVLNELRISVWLDRCVHVSSTLPAVGGPGLRRENVRAGTDREAGLGHDGACC